MDDLEDLESYPDEDEALQSSMNDIEGRADKITEEFLELLM